MKSLERRYRKIAAGNPYWSSATCFYEAVKGQGFSKRIIGRYFNRLVENDDYDRRDKKAILDHLLTGTYQDVDRPDDG